MNENSLMLVAVLPLIVVTIDAITYIVWPEVTIILNSLYVNVSVYVIKSDALDSVFVCVADDGYEPSDVPTFTDIDKPIEPV